MKQQAVILFLALSLILSLPALADHSVLPAAGDLNETQALDRAVAYLCSEKNLREEDVRGHWFFFTAYYEHAKWLEGYEGAAWSVLLVDPDASCSYESQEMVPDETEEKGWRWEKQLRPAMLRYSFTLNVADGSLLEQTEEPFPLEGTAGSFRLILVPDKSRLQPQEALDRAYGFLARALQVPEEEARATFRDYHLGASSALGSSRCWYHAELYAFGSVACSYHVYLDLDSGELIEKTDDRIIAGRFALWQQGIDHATWYWEQVQAQEAEWGPEDTWDYRQNAAFEEKCFGYPYYVLNLAAGLPRADECTLEQAEAAARGYLAGQYGVPEQNWKLTGSLFWADCWGDWEDRLSRFETAAKRLWQLTFENEAGETETVYVDPSACEIEEGGHG